MADRHCATIEILKSHIKKYPELEKAIQQEFYNPDGTLIDNDNWDENSPIACFKDIEARYGYFENIEDLLIKHKVPFDRWTSAYDEGAYYAVYRPDINPNEPIILDGDLYERTFSERELRTLTNGLNLDTPQPSVATLITIGERFLAFLNKLKPIRPLISYMELSNEKEK